MHLRACSMKLRPLPLPTNVQACGTLHTFQQEQQDIALMDTTDTSERPLHFHSRTHVKTAVLAYCGHQASSTQTNPPYTFMLLGELSAMDQSSS